MKKKLVIFSLVVIASGHVLNIEYNRQNSHGIDPFITNGERAVLGQFPYQAAILMNLGFDTHICGGTIIKHRWILTAAQCLSPLYTGHRVILGSIEPIVGGNVWRSSSISRSDIRVHPQYSNRTYINNIGLIFVNEMPVNVFDSLHVGTIDMPTIQEAETLQLTGRVGTISGYGRISDTTSAASGVLHFTQQTIIPNSVCQNHGFDVTNGTLCMNSTGERSICGGDSGGPLTIQLNENRRVLVGVIGVTVLSCTIEVPMVFESVIYHRQWIEDNSQNSSAVSTLNISIAALVALMILKNMY